MISKKAMLVLVIAISAIITWIILSDESNPSFTAEHKTSTGNTQNKTSYNKTSIEPTISLVKPTVTPYLTEYALPNGTGPNSILVDRDGIVWTVGSTLHTLFRLDPRTNEMQQYQIPGENEAGDYMSWSMLQDNEGFIWFSQFGSNPLWRFDPSSDIFTAYSALAPPFQMKLDAKTDDIWFTTLSGDTLGVVQKVQNSTDPHTEYRISEFSIGNETTPSGLFLRGSFVLVAELGQGKIVKFEPVRDSNSGEITGITKISEMPTTNGTLFYSPTDIMFSDNNTAWITEHGSSTITKFHMDTQSLTRFPTSQNLFHVASLPFWLRESEDGQGIWFDEHEGGNIAFLGTYNNTLTEYKLQNNSDAVFMLNLALDPQDPDKAWFSEWNADKIGVVNRDIPVPFEISSDTSDLVFDTKRGQKQATVDIQITKEPMPPNDNRHLLFLNTTSSMTPDGELENMTLSLSQSMIDLTKIGQSTSVKYTIYDKSVQAGNYTLGISASNGLVTKTIFLKLTVR